MTIEQFVSKWEGKHLEVYDPSNPNQCVDLVLEWIKEQGHGDLIPLGILNAYELWTKTPQRMLEFYDKIPNTTDAIPLPGDIIVFKKAQLKTSSEQPDPSECYFEEVLNKYFNQQVTIDFVINYLDDLKAERDKLNKAITDKDKKIAQLRQEVEVVKNKAKADLAKAGVDCKKGLDDQKARYFIELETKDMRIKDLEIQIEEAGCVILEHEKPRDGLHRRIVDLLDAWWGYTK